MSILYFALAFKLKGSNYKILMRISFVVNTLTFGLACWSVFILNDKKFMAWNQSVKTIEKFSVDSI